MTSGTILCLDEMGPVAAKVYPGARWSDGAHRPHFTPDYGRSGKVWVFGVLEPRSGRALTGCASRRDSAALAGFLDEVDRAWPDGEVHVVLDNLSIHRGLAAFLWTQGHPRFAFHFLPTYAPWLNLIEPWWRTLRKLALEGSRPADAPAIVDAVTAATAYWNDHPHPYTWRKAA